MSNFEKALPVILAHEGGYVDHPNDHGGATKQGITQRAYDAYRQRCGLPLRSVKYIDGNEVAEIYEQEYWNPVGCGVMPYRVALCVFDANVNHRPGKAVKFLQQVIGVEADGILGPQTLSRLASALEAPGEQAVVDQLLAVRSQFFDAIVKRDPTQSVFLKGWKNRIERLRKEVE